MLNRTVLVGRLTRDPDLRYVGDGKPVVSFTIAVNRTFKNQNGETEADFINCVAWLQHAQEEVIDLAVYLEAAIQKFDELEKKFDELEREKA
ncbi:Single-stranded DNA-binding protein A [Bacillus licheniformis]|uniref:Single-stranded DNA-binding protein n=2 Tax=Bacillus licheniformis TaxID=1402 RepID=Q65KQ8_BACLD|nr:single-strand DNA-binding protein [Bacillus licheniformis DSM 13 = ATCC 14580]ARC62568.1 single-stranded DNA-binding protein ssb [Bacillus licheniformis]MBY8349917.1 single-stranded DNA-binding protein [Bacillus sp. PCH94]NYV81531.1 single-stranded DNA-binding protein [Bacillus sp. Gen2]PZW87948.1 single stranded DNA-binding protein [Bacillus sp. AG442]